MNNKDEKISFKYSVKEYINKDKESIKVLSCFSGGGGSTIGYKLNGYQVIANIEIDKKQNDIYLKNHTPKYNYNKDIREVVDMSKNKKLPKELYELDILDGSPPCSVFSSCGLRDRGWGKEKKFREGQKPQTLDDLFFVFGDLLNELKPKVVIGENVIGIIQGKAKTEYAEKIISMYEEIDYYAKYFVLNSKDMGVPQSRNRVFFIGIRKDLMSYNEFKLIEKELIFNEKEIKFKEVQKKVKIQDKLTFLKKNTKNTILFKNLKTGENNLSYAHKRLFGKRAAFGRVVLWPDKIPNTIVSHNTYLYSDKPCCISKEELILISSFPYDYDFINNSLNNIKYVCGMAVPPFMTKAISKRIIDFLNNIKKY